MCLVSAKQTEPQRNEGLAVLGRVWWCCEPIDWMARRRHRYSEEEKEPKENKEESSKKKRGVKRSRREELFASKTTFTAVE